MKHQKIKKKNNNIKHSKQLSQTSLNPSILLTDQNIINCNENMSYKIIKNSKIKNEINNSNINNNEKNKIVVIYNFSNNHLTSLEKQNFNNFVIKSPTDHRHNNSLDKKAAYDFNANKNYKRKIYIPKTSANGRNLNNSINTNILYHSVHKKEIKDFKPKFKNNIKSESYDKKICKNLNMRLNQNLDLNLSNYSTDFQKDNLNKSPKQFNLSLTRKLDNTKTNDEIKPRKYIYTTENKLNKKILNLKEINNSNIYRNNINTTLYNNTNLNNSNINTTLYNNANLNNSIIYNKRKMNKKINISSFPSKPDNISLKVNNKYSDNKQLDILKTDINEQINNINNNYNKVKNLSDKDNIKKNSLILDIILNSFLKFRTLLENPKEKEVAFEIIQKLNDFLKSQDNLINTIIKKNVVLNNKYKKYKKKNKNIKKENILLLDKIDNLEKRIEDLENKLKNYNDLNKYHYNKSLNNNLTINNLNENKILINENNDNEEKESSVNSEELESIRFFDKIIMKKLTFSKSYIPELEIKKILKNINDENQLNKNNKNLNNGNNFNKKNIRIRLRKKRNKISKSVEYS